MALPIGEGQTISPPFIVAYMTEAIDPQPTDKVLEIGTGSGYQAAVLVEAGAATSTRSRSSPRWATRPTKTLERLHYDNVHVKVGDGYQGWPEHAPFDKIIVTCSPENVPPALVEQLKEGGRMVIPVRRALPADALPAEEDRRQDGGRGLAADAVRADDRQGRGEPRGAARPRQADDRQRRLRERRRRSARCPPAGTTSGNSKLVSDKDAPEGKNYVTFNNTMPGRGSQALQGFAVDGRKVAAVAAFGAGPRPATFGPARTRSNCPASSSTSTTRTAPRSARPAWARGAARSIGRPKPSGSTCPRRAREADHAHRPARRRGRNLVRRRSKLKAVKK